MMRTFIPITLSVGLLAAAISLIAFSAYGGNQPLLVITAGVFAWLTACVGAWRIDARYAARRSVIGPAFTTVACIAFFIVTAATNWPLRAIYASSRSSLDAVAESVRELRPINVPLKVGAFTIRRVELARVGVICLWTNEDSGDRIGFVQCPPGRAPLCAWSDVSLDDRWQYVSED